MSGHWTGATPSQCRDSVAFSQFPQLKHMRRTQIECGATPFRPGSVATHVVAKIGTDDSWTAVASRSQVRFHRKNVILIPNGSKVRKCTTGRADRLGRDWD